MAKVAKLQHTPTCMPQDALWTLFEQRGDKLVRISPLELPYKQALSLWESDLCGGDWQELLALKLEGKPLPKPQYRRKLRPVTLTVSGKLALTDWQGHDGTV